MRQTPKTTISVDCRHYPTSGLYIPLALPLGGSSRLRFILGAINDDLVYGHSLTYGSDIPPTPSHKVAECLDIFLAVVEKDAKRLQNALKRHFLLQTPNPICRMQPSCEKRAGRFAIVGYDGKRLESYLFNEAILYDACKKKKSWR